MEDVYIREIRQGDNTNRLSLGDKNFHLLKIFLQKHALDWHEKNITKTYVLVAENMPNRVLGFLSLICSEIKIPDSNRLAEQLKVYPAIKIARLAIDKSVQGRGYGKHLINHAYMIIKNAIMPHVGCRYVIVDSKKTAIPFYEKLGFILLNTEVNIKEESPLMILDMYPYLDKSYNLNIPRALNLEKLEHEAELFA